ncbi:HD domain-containing protein [Epilithonimonas sp.]|uniref:HD domain-containing protein n=1 Tax=Epilithonimonas sp. TaxID=2894511 RepID=UPI002FDD1232
MIFYLNSIFSDLISKHSDNEILKTDYWKEIEKAYSQKSRKYHNLTHLENMILEMEEVKDEILDYDSILFSIFYHDIIYKATSKDNEEKSAELAKTRLEKLDITKDKIIRICNQILATKSHKKSEDSDTNFLIDADLAILGQDWTIYENYTQQIRKEYSIYPDFMYKPGRKKVLIHFLEFDEIFKTDYFKAKYEEKARENIQKELEII